VNPNMTEIVIEVPLHEFAVASAEMRAWLIEHVLRERRRPRRRAVTRALCRVL
jgi:hypothetical protein